MSGEKLLRRSLYTSPEWRREKADEFINSEPLNRRSNTKAAEAELFEFDEEARQIANAVESFFENQDYQNNEEVTNK